MDYEDHDSCGDLVAHHGEQDEAGCHEMMKHPLVVFFFIFFNNHQFEDGENVHTQLETKIHFELWPLA